MSDSVIGRAAMALANEFLGQESASSLVDIDDLSSVRIDGNFDLKMIVRSILNSVRDPSEAMVEEAYASDAFNAGDPDNLWKVMIDQALQDG